MKKVMNSYYVHKSNKFELLNSSLPGIEHVRKIVLGLEGFMTYQIIKYDVCNRKLSLIESPNWDTANEPTVGDSYVYDLSKGIDLSDTPHKLIKGRKKNPQIYHSKELFVDDNYTGFDIDKAKKRTELWKSIKDMDKKRIGNQDYWFELLDANGIER